MARGVEPLSWTPAQVAAVTGREAPDRPRITFGVQLSRSTRRGRYEIYEAVLNGRWGLGVVAVYDRRAHRHRWLFRTGGCVLGLIRWIGGQGSLLVGVARPPHPGLETGDQPFVVDLERGTVHYLWLRGPFASDPSEWELEDLRYEGRPAPPPSFRVRRGALLVRLRDGGALRIPLARARLRSRRGLVEPPRWRDPVGE